MKTVQLTLDQQRHAAQLAFAAGGAELRVGDEAALPLPLATLLATRSDSPYVVETHTGGLTATVHRIRAGGRDWTLKLARAEARVRNIDGQTSFLNEVQRRADFTRLKAQPGGRERFAAIVDTVFASYRHGVLLSPWIDGDIVAAWDARRIHQLLQAACACAAAGLFEWDLSPGNVLDDGAQVRLFDFGYMYPFDPRTQFNSAGRGDDVPLFHPAERFETRNYFGVLLRIERERERGAAAALAAFRLEKEIALEVYREHRAQLAALGASAAVLGRLDALIARWQRALTGELAALYLSEGWRSHLLDLDDDLHGQSCTPMTLARADWLLAALTDRFDELVAQQALFGRDAGGSQSQLLDAYRQRRAQAEQFQLGAG